MFPNLQDLFSVSGWLWEPIIKELGAQGVGLFKSQWNKIRAKDAIKKYQQRIKELHSTTRVLGNPRPISLEGLFTDILVFDQITAQRHATLTELNSNGQARAGAPPVYRERVNALDLVKKTDYLFVLGKPGAGKTTLLKYLTITTTHKTIDKTPIFVSLHKWTQMDVSLLDYIEKQFEICEFPDAKPFIKILLQKGQALLLFDGLDEVVEEQGKREQVINFLLEFTDRYPKNKYIITCRAAAVDFSFEKFTYVEIADFTEPQIASFVRKWFIDPIKAEKMLDELKRRDKRNLSDLAKTPILLALLCLNFEEAFTFPLRRSEIYEEAIDALLKKWDSSRNIKRDEIYHGLSLTRKRQLLADIAAYFFARGEIFFREEDISQLINSYLLKLPSREVGAEPNGEYVLKAIESQHGILVEQAQNIYSFSHLTFQEYFTAREIIDNVQKNSIEWMMTNRLNEKRWHEVFLLTSSLLPDATLFFRVFSQRLKQFFKGNQKLEALDKWANQKSQRYEQVEHPVIRKIMALELILDLELAKYFVVHKDRKFENSIKRERARTIDKIIHEGDEARARVDVNIERDKEYRLDRTLIRLLKNAIDRNASTYVENLLHVAIFSSVNNAGISETLIGLKVPGIGPGFQEDWERFNQALVGGMIKYQNLGQAWELNQEEMLQVDLYLEALVLFLECMQISAVENRDEFEQLLCKP